MSDFSAALAYVLEREGGFARNRFDRGGPTMWGITQRTYDHWRQRKGLESQSVRKITEDERDTIYREDYWLPGGCEQLPEKIAIAHFDCAVNSGVHMASVLLQRALGVADDGIVGRITIAAANAQDEDEVLRRLLDIREEFVKWIAAKDWTQQANLRGWINRINLLRKAVGVAED